MKNIWYYDYPIGRLAIAANGDSISHIFFGEGGLSGFAPLETALIRRASEQLREYFEGRRAKFELPLEPGGTDFQRAVWDALLGIAPGETRSYKQIAELVGNSRACRAVGMANHNNPIAIVIPCHRVINSSGGLGGYAGGLEVKRYLLDLEKQYI